MDEDKSIKKVSFKTDKGEDIDLDSKFVHKLSEEIKINL